DSPNQKENTTGKEQDETRRPNKRQKLLSPDVIVNEHEKTPQLSDSYTPASSPSLSHPDPMPYAEYRESPFSGTLKYTRVGDDVYCTLEFTTSRIPDCLDVSELPKLCIGREVRKPLVTQEATPNRRKSRPRARYILEDDQKLILLRERGLLWSEIAKEFPERSEGALRLRYSMLGPSANQQRKSTRSGRKAHPGRDESPGPDNDNSDEYYLDKISRHRIVANGSIEYDVLWVGGGCTWEPHTAMMNTEALEIYLQSCLPRG
ncbi:hypothetical protein QBC37DRAFT_458606, partial [Rhypophila decipiens]